MSEKAGNRRMAGLRQRQNLGINSTAVQLEQARQTPLHMWICVVLVYFLAYLSEAEETWKLNICEFMSTV